MKGLAELNPKLDAQSAMNTVISQSNSDPIITIPPKVNIIGTKRGLTKPDGKELDKDVSMSSVNSDEDEVLVQWLMKASRGLDYLIDISTPIHLPKEGGRCPAIMHKPLANYGDNINVAKLKAEPRDDEINLPTDQLISLLRRDDYSEKANLSETPSMPWKRRIIEKVAEEKSLER